VQPTGFFSSKKKRKYREPLRNRARARKHQPTLQIAPAACIFSERRMQIKKLMLPILFCSALVAGAHALPRPQPQGLQHAECAKSCERTTVAITCPNYGRYVTKVSGCTADFSVNPPTCGPLAPSKTATCTPGHEVNEATCDFVDKCEGEFEEE
jgi:hypothetical protein